jgi:hypothetical protein
MSGSAGHGGDRAADHHDGDPRADHDADHHDSDPRAGRPAGGLQAGPGTAPVLTVVRGDASAEEIAALTAVLAAKTSAAAGPSAAGRAQRVTGWGSRPAMLRRPLRHGPGLWRASARPGFWA